MSINHEAHHMRIKAISQRMNHPMTYNDAGAPRGLKEQNSKVGGHELAAQHMERLNKVMLGGR
jgi:hypothetical protein